MPPILFKEAPATYPSIHIGTEDAEEGASLSRKALVLPNLMLLKTDIFRAHTALHPGMRPIEHPQTLQPNQMHQSVLPP